jgi:DNA-binding response OmpR family regulator
MDQEQKKVLVIDDSKETRELIAELIGGDEFEVLLAPGGREGIMLAKMKKPDLILLDMEMPKMNGIGTCRVLKKNPMLQNIPVIFLTANKNPDDVKMAIAAGGQDYIVKPFNPEELLARIRKLLTKTGFNPNSVIRG